MRIEVDVPASPDIIEFRIKFRKIEMASSYVYYRLTHASLQKVAAFEKRETLLPGSVMWQKMLPAHPRLISFLSLQVLHPSCRRT